MRRSVTGVTDFHGFHLARRRLNEGYEAVEIGHITPYCNVNLRKARHIWLEQSSHYLVTFEGRLDLEALLAAEPIEQAVHLAA